MKARLVNIPTEHVIQEFDLTEHIDASGEGWQNSSGETLTYEGHPIPYKFNGISGYISVEVTGKCLFFYVFDGDVMYDEIGEFSVNPK